FENCLHPLRADAARNADRATLFRQIREERRRLIDDARSRRDRPDLRGTHVGAGDTKVVEIEARVGARPSEDAAGRSTDMQALELSSCTPGFRQDLAELRAERDLVDPRPDHSAGD